MRRIELEGSEATRSLGRALAEAVRGGLCILLEGDLGAGKTTLCQGFIEDRTGIAYAASPTFTLLQAYPGGIYHLDLYRLAHADLREFDMEEIFAPDALLLVEWPERAAGEWPKERLEIRLGGEGSRRLAELEAFGPAAGEALARLGWPL
jgi:tRNA threonylcarbamoyladenosine biosynthesis protein TsaE